MNNVFIIVVIMIVVVVVVVIIIIIVVISAYTRCTQACRHTAEPHTKIPQTKIL